MGVGRGILLRAFGRPRGLLGRLGGVVMARGNCKTARWAIDLLEVGRHDRVLEVGFGPGVGIALLAAAAPDGQIAGVDSSREMVGQASARNAAAIGSGRVDLRLGSAEDLPFEDDAFDRALTINSMQVWRDGVAGLGELRRVLKPGGRVAVVFNRNSGQSREGLPAALDAAGFAEVHLVEAENAFCLLATRP